MKAKLGNSGDVVLLEERNRPEVMPEGKGKVVEKTESEQILTETEVKEDELNAKETEILKETKSTPP